MDIFHYDENNIFTHTSEARENPRSPGNFLVPANATTVAPGSNPPGTALIWEGDQWGIVEDRRGEEIYEIETGEKSIMQNAGPIPATHTALVPNRGQSWDSQKKVWTYRLPYLKQYLTELRDNAAQKYPYKGVDIVLGSGQRADLGALYTALTAGQLADDFVLPWSETGYEETELSTIYITKAELAAFCLGAMAQRQKAFGAFPAVLSRVVGGELKTPDQVAEAYESALSA